VLSSAGAAPVITARSTGAVVTISGGRGIGNGTVTPTGVTNDVTPLALDVTTTVLDGGTGSVHVTNTGNLDITSARADGDIEAATGGDLRAGVVGSLGAVRLSAGNHLDVDTVSGATGVELAAGGNLTVGTATSASGNVTLGALTIDDPIDELAGRTVTVRATEGDIVIRKLTFETANLTAAEEGARLHVLSAIAQASRIVARADRIDLDTVTSTSTSTLFFDLAGNDGGLAMSTNVNALRGSISTAGVSTPGLIQFDRLHSTDATVSGGIPNIRFMETLIGRQATFANHSRTYDLPFTVRLDNVLATLRMDQDALLSSTAPFYLYFQDAKVFETNANVIYRNPEFRIQGSNGDVVNDTSLEQVLKRRIDPPAPAGRVTISIPGNVLGRNDGAIDGEDDLRITLPRRPSLGLRR
jgi:hypothetical protein